MAKVREKKEDCAIFAGLLQRKEKEKLVWSQKGVDLKKKEKSARKNAVAMKKGGLTNSADTKNWNNH